jgi:hypothetical protein
MHSLTFELIWRTVVLPDGHGCTCVLALPMAPPGALQQTLHYSTLHYMRHSKQEWDPIQKPMRGS